MNADKIIAAESVVAVAAISTGDLLAQGDARGLPNPRRILATLFFYGGLSLVASAGEGPARFSAAAGGVAMLTTLVIGPGGKAITSLLGNVTSFAQTPDGSPPSLSSVWSSLTAYGKSGSGKGGSFIAGSTPNTSGARDRSAPSTTSNLTPPSFSG